MQRGRGGQNDLFGFNDPFAGFGGFGGIGHGSMLSGFPGGRDPFDDPFFTRPFGAPFGSFPSSMFGSMGSSPFDNIPVARILEHQQPQPNKQKGPIIEELDSDDEVADDERSKGKRDNARKHSGSEREHYVEEPDDVDQGNKGQHMLYGNAYTSMTNMQPQPQPHSFTFQSSTVTYGGANGPYYTKSTTRRAGSDGVSFEEFKEADSSAGQATHRISRGLNNKGHSLTRKLNSDGRVDSMQTLHNLNEDELTGFEEAWKGNSRQLLPGWKHQLEGHGNFGSIASSQNGESTRGGWALPSSQHAHSGMMNPDVLYATASQPQARRNASNGSQGRTRD
ncbi:hypothetical protein Dimus_008872 [Dionaea muscipula]